MASVRGTRARVPFQRMYARKWGAFTVACVLLGVCGCTSNPHQPRIVGVTIEDGDLILSVGDSHELTVSVVATGPIMPDVTWSTDALAVADVDEGGVVTATGEGLAEITATSARDPSKSDTIQVLVIAVESSLWLDPAVATVLPGDSVEFTAYSSYFDPEHVTWSASAGTVSGSGSSITFMPPASAGYFEVTATSTDAPEQSATATVRVVVVDHAAPCTAPDEVIAIPDNALRARIGERVGLAGGVLTCGHMQTLTDLGPSGATVQDLEGLQHAANLSEVDLSDSRVVRLDPLLGLNLERLDLRQNRYVVDLAPLAGHLALTYLDLDGNSVADLSPLASLIALEYLAASGSEEITDIGPIAGLTELRHLSLGYNQIADIGPLAGLTNLESLSPTNNVIEDVSAMEGLINLDGAIYLTYNLIKDLAPLVANAGIGSGDTVFLDYNCVDMSPGSPAAGDVEALTDRGALVFTTPLSDACPP